MDHVTLALALVLLSWNAIDFAMKLLNSELDASVTINLIVTILMLCFLGA